MATSQPGYSLALYRKYRPTSLAEVVGQEQITSTLENSLKHGKISHAYLFIGPRGTGKTSVARILAHAINQFDYQVEDSYLDIIEIDAASNTGVDNIRELREKAVIAPTSGQYKVYIIDEIHMLTKSASNALLKTLEEPPEHVIFIMATTDAHKVPITISSRAQIHTFHLATPEVMLSHLQKIVQNEQIDITEEALKIVAHRGGGSFRDTLSLLDQVSTLTDQQITAELLNNALGLPQDQSIKQLLEAYRTGDQATISNLLKELLNTGLRAETIASEAIAAIIEHSEPALLPLLARLPNVQAPFPEAKLFLALLENISTQKSNTPAASDPASTFIGDNASLGASNTSAVPNPASAPKNDGNTEDTTDTTNTTNSPQTHVEAVSGTSRQKASSRQALAEKLAKRAAERQKAQNHPQSDSENDQNTPDSASNARDAAPATSLTFDQRSSRDFTWEDFLETVRAENNAIYSQLTKTDYELQGTVLHIYPQLKLTKGILDRSGNREILTSCLPTGITFEIHEFGERKLPEDPQFSQISAIMGDIQEAKGDLPF